MQPIPVSRLSLARVHRWPVARALLLGQPLALGPLGVLRGSRLLQIGALANLVVLHIKSWGYTISLWCYTSRNRVGLVVWNEVELTLFLSFHCLPSSSYGRWKLGRIGWAIGQDGNWNPCQPSPCFRPPASPCIDKNTLDVKTYNWSFTHVSLNEVLDLLDLLRVRLLGQFDRQFLPLVRLDLVDEFVAVPKELQGEEAGKLGIGFIFTPRWAKFTKLTEHQFCKIGGSPMKTKLMV